MNNAERLVKATASKTLGQLRQIAARECVHASRDADGDFYEFADGSVLELENRGCQTRVRVVEAA